MQGYSKIRQGWTNMSIMASITDISEIHDRED